MKSTITYDGSFPGLFTVLYDIYLLKIKEPYIKSRFDKNGDLFNDEIEICTCADKSEKVFSKLKDLIGPINLKKLYKVYLSEDHQAENLIIQYCRTALTGNTACLNDYGDSTVSSISKLVKKVSRETHRMNAFIRFKEIEKGHYFAVCSPDFDVLPLITNHFKNRYQDQIWTIYDENRDYGVHYDLIEVNFVKLEKARIQNTSINPAIISEVKEKEDHYASLWKTYFQNVNIASRKNTKLFTQHMPKRYWKYLSELS